MTNSFYNDFDILAFDRPRPPDRLRTPFQHDRDRVIHTSAFRRLQAKTQVFKSGEYDFYRTRLTHSIEVGQIGRGICNFLQKTSPLLNDGFYIDADLVEACCLSHDIGHPPFGHAGERSLHSLMGPYGGFEGNAQTLRLISRTIFSEGGKRKGMNPTRAFMDGIIKYKTFYRDRSKEKHFIYDDQRECLEFVNGDADLVESAKSIECQIMD